MSKLSNHTVKNTSIRVLFPWHRYLTIWERDSAIRCLVAELVTPRSVWIKSKNQIKVKYEGKKIQTDGKDMGTTTHQRIISDDSESIQYRVNTACKSSSSITFACILNSNVILQFFPLYCTKAEQTTLKPAQDQSHESRLEPVFTYLYQQKNTGLPLVSALGYESDSQPAYHLVLWLGVFSS